MREIPFPSHRDAAPRLKCLCVIELDYLDAGRRVFVATDEKGWMIAHGMGTSDQECDKVLTRLSAALAAYRARERPHLMRP